MLKKINFKTSTILSFGLVLIAIGVLLGFIEYFMEKKDFVFSQMNLSLFENEMPELINSDEQLEKEEPPIDNNDSTIDNTIENNNTSSDANYDYIGILEIPKINLKRGFLNIKSRYNKVNYNVTVIQGSTLPNKEKSTLILAAHSGICKVCYFNDLYKLNVGDIAYVYYENIKYKYKIVDIYEVEKDGTVAIYRDYTKSGLVLITCTRNSNTKQTVYIYELENKENY